LAASVLLCVAVSLAGCGDISRFQTASPAGAPAPKPARTVAQTPAAEREHERILSSYGGAYDDPRLEALITKTVDRLVAASDRPDLAYRVTILNSGAVNAFALPTGQLYVTRGLIALASDTSELATRWRMCWQNTPRSARIRRGRPPSSPAWSPTWATIPISPLWRLQNQN
jgi:predicted Zn-dependent protease